jgi:hypothetical protein
MIPLKFLAGLLTVPRLFQPVKAKRILLPLSLNSSKLMSHIIIFGNGLSDHSVITVLIMCRSLNSFVQLLPMYMQANIRDVSRGQDLLQNS